MENIKKLATVLALIFVVVILSSTYLAIWLKSPAVEDYLSLTKLILSWPVAAGGLVFGGGQTIIKAWKNQ